MKTSFVPWTVLLCFSLLSTQTFSQKRQSDYFAVGQSNLFMQIGVVPTYLMDKSKIVLPPMGLRAEHRFGQQYSLGIESAYSVSQKSRFYTQEQEWREYENSSYFFGIRNSVHCNCQRTKNIDLYGGFTLGYQLTIIDVLNGDFGPSEYHRNILPKRGTVTYSGFVGFRYACGPWLSLSGEIGFGVSLVQLGVGIKI